MLPRLKTRGLSLRTVHTFKEAAMKNYTVNVGLDGSLKTIHVSLAIAGRNGEVRRFGDIP